jgi:formate hydrogenlyase transcriptional activator
VEEGAFRHDLYYRLNVFPIVIPPLRERTDDIPRLARYFTARAARRLRRPLPDIPKHVMDALVRWKWPGNIRELENVIERAVILSEGRELHVPPHDVQPREIRTTPDPASASTLDEVNRETILKALRASRGIVGGPGGAAARLGLKRTTLQSLMRRLDIRRPSY